MTPGIELTTISLSSSQFTTSESYTNSDTTSEDMTNYTDSINTTMPLSMFSMHLDTVTISYHFRITKYVFSPDE